MTRMIKICGMREPANIAEVSDLYPELMGFIFYKASARYAGDTGEEIMNSIPAGISKTGVFVNADAREILQTAVKFSLDIIQLHGNETAGLCARLKSRGLGVIKSFSVGSDEDFSRCSEYISCTDYFLFDTPTIKYGGSGSRFDWKLLERYRYTHPFFLSGGISAEDAESIVALDHPSLAGIDLNSRFEISPGLKDVEKLRNFILQIRNNKIL
jgi:phosphoribosylanthranilate isomerase